MSPPNPSPSPSRPSGPGYGPGGAVARTLAAAEVAVLTDPQGRPVVATTPDGSR